MNFLTGGAVWRDHNQRLKARLTPEVYREYKLVAGQKHQATKTVEELQARRRKYYREREARASDPDHYKALKEGQQQRHLEQWKADKEYNEESKMRRKERSCCYWEKNKEEVRARRRAKYQEQKKDPALMERKRQRDCEWHRKKAKALSKPPPLAPSTLPSPDRSGSDTRSSDKREPLPRNRHQCPPLTSPTILTPITMRTMIAIPLSHPSGKLSAFVSIETLKTVQGCTVLSGGWCSRWLI